jgi:hypothetical protein
MHGILSRSCARRANAIKSVRDPFLAPRLIEFAHSIKRVLQNEGIGDALFSHERSLPPFTLHAV